MRLRGEVGEKKEVKKGGGGGGRWPRAKSAISCRLHRACRIAKMQTITCKSRPGMHFISLPLTSLLVDQVGFRHTLVLLLSPGHAATLQMPCSVVNNLL